MSSLSDFVNEHRNKTSVRNSISVANLGTKISNSFNGFFKPEDSEDRETLTDTPSLNGQLHSSRNRKTSRTSWLSFSIIKTEEPPCGLSRFQRIFAFFLFLIGAMFCFATSIMLIPVLVLQTRKFAALNALGSIFFIISFGFLWGPSAYVQFLFSAQRRIVTATYLISVFATLYTSLWLQNTIFTIVCFCFESVALLWYLLSYVPGGENGLKFMTKISTQMCCSTSQSSKLVLPI